MSGNGSAKLTPRRCRFCGGRYVHPEGSSRAHAGCPRCQPSLFDSEELSATPDAKAASRRV